MNRKWTRCLIVAGLVLMAVPVPDCWAEPRHRFTAKFSAPPEPARETSTRVRSGFRFNRDFTALSYALRVDHGAAVMGAELHCGRPDDPGPILATLLGNIEGGLSGTVLIRAALTAANLVEDTDCTRFAPAPITNLADLAAAMDQGAVYVEIVSEAAPEGAIQGQVRPAGSRTTAEAGTAGTPLAQARHALVQATLAQTLAQQAAAQASLAHSRFQQVATLDTAGPGGDMGGYAESSRASARSAAQWALETAGLAITEATAAQVVAEAAFRAATEAERQARDRDPEMQREAEIALRKAGKARVLATAALSEAQAARARARALPF